MGIFSWKKSYITEQTQSQLLRKGRYACTTTSPVISTFCLAVATIDLQSFIFTSMQFFVGFFWKLQAALYTFFPIIHILRKYCVLRALTPRNSFEAALPGACPFSTHLDINVTFADNYLPEWRSVRTKMMGWRDGKSRSNNPVSISDSWLGERSVGCKCDCVTVENRSLKKPHRSSDSDSGSS